MKTIPNKVKHSETKNAWNIVGTVIGGSYKLARIPYPLTDDEEINNRNRKEAFERAKFISRCLNKADEIF